MIALITIVILLTCLVLGFFILIQAPKGGGLTGAFGSLSSQVMGVKQSTDVMEKGTWTSVGIVAALCIISVSFYSTPKVEKNDKQPAKSSAPAQPAPAAPAGGAQPQGK